MSQIEREPCFWTSTRPGYNSKDRELVSFVDGKRIVERVPQRGHQGDYEDRRPARGIRSVRTVRSDGHTVHMVLTNGAAHLDHTTQFGQYQNAKAEHLGWYPVGSCPLARLANGQLQPQHFRVQSMLKETPCAPKSYSEKSPCKHSIAEELARKAAWASGEMAELEHKFKNSSDKLAEAQRDQTSALVGAITAAMAAKDSKK